jgi:hypothetical protein
MEMNFGVTVSVPHPVLYLQSYTWQKDILRNLGGGGGGNSSKMKNAAIGLGFSELAECRLQQADRLQNNLHQKCTLYYNTKECIVT